MNESFSAADFTKTVGDDLVNDFDKARKATTPGSIGSAMESSVRTRLNQLLPRGIEVGSGYIIDTFGGTSRQMDIVLYEAGTCPVFSVNASPSSTYYPCEGVLAVGEIKSRIGKKELEDCFDKIRSVKRLRRAYEHSSDRGGYTYYGRPYGNPGGQSMYAFDLENTNIGDIFAFILGGESAVHIIPSGKSSPGLLEHYRTNVESAGHDTLCPDTMVLLDGVTIEPRTVTFDKEKCPSDRYTPTRSRPALPHAISYGKGQSPFADLIISVWERYENGLTAQIPLSRYMRYLEHAPERELYKVPIANCPKDTIGQMQAGTITQDEAMATVKTPVEHLRHELNVVISYRSASDRTD